MTSYTTNRLLAQPQVGGDSNVWGPPINSNQTVLDQILSQSVALSFASISADFAVSQAQMQYLIFAIAGTPSVSTVRLVLYAGMAGWWIVANGTPNTVNVVTATGGSTGISVEPGGRTLITSDGTNVYLMQNSSGVRVLTSGSTTTLVANQDSVLVVNKASGSATGVTLPTTGGGPYTIADGKGDAGANPITITPASGTINGAASYIISANFGSVTVLSDGANWIVAGSAAQTGFSTGDAKLTWKTVADAGWVILNDGSIGSAASGGSTRANADTAALYSLVWTNIGVTYAPMADGNPYGSSASADFAANRALVLSKQLGRALAGAGTGSGLTAHPLGSFTGSETATLSTGNLPAHNHAVNDPGHNHAITEPNSGQGHQHAFTADVGSVEFPGGNNNGPVGNPNASTQPTHYATTGITINAATTGITIANTGGGAAFSIEQPVSFWNVMVKL